MFNVNNELKWNHNLVSLIKCSVDDGYFSMTINRPHICGKQSFKWTTKFFSMVCAISQ